MATIYIENVPHEVDPEQNLLAACLSLGFNLPYFCWHPAMGSVGACRQCAVKQFRDETDTAGRIVMACMTPASEGTRISIEDPEAREMRENVIAWMMTNHPHDCPVCDEGGECHLQDMTVMTGHDTREYDYTKRTYNNQYLGPFIHHEMNRCIQCYRCVRFYREYADGRDFNVFAAHNHLYFGRADDGILESAFSGNLIEVCPTGVFTDKTLRRHYTRKWDLQNAPSICGHCGVGCNLIGGARYGTLRRVVNRYNREVNGYFICDRGRFGYEFVNHESRITMPQLRDGHEVGAAARAEAVQTAGRAVENGRCIGIGSPRASLEANYALREVVGEANYCVGVPEREAEVLSRIVELLRQGPARSASLRDVEKADAVFVLGEDLTETAPMLALAVRQAVRNRPFAEAAKRLHLPHWHDAALREVVQNEKGPCYLTTVAESKLEDVAAVAAHGAPDDLARLGFAVAHAIDPDAPEVEGLTEDEGALAADIGKALVESSRPVVLSGASLVSVAIIEAAHAVATALIKRSKPAQLSYTVPECNSMGVAMLGGMPLEKALAAIEDGRADSLLVLENDLYRRIERERVDAVLRKARNVAVLDHSANATTRKAGVILPAAAFYEADGTFVNNEGRAQRFFQVYVPKGEIQESWRWLREIGFAAGKPLTWENLDAATHALAAAVPAFARIPEAAPDASFRAVGQKIPRESHRASGRTAMHANLAVSEPKPPGDPDSPLSFSMEGHRGKPPAPIIPLYWAPGWNSVQSLSKFQAEVAGHLHGGAPSVRLIEPGDRREYVGSIPRGFTPRAGQALVVPLFHIFGSDEQSARAAGLAERIPQPYVLVRPEHAAEMGIEEGMQVEVTLGHAYLRLPARLSRALPAGVAALPVGLPGQEHVALPDWGIVQSVQGMHHG